MTDLTEQRINIQAEETVRRGSLSEALFTRVGQSINFVNKRQFDTHQFNFNGQYSGFKGIVGADGCFPARYNIRIIGITMYNRRAGTSGTTEIDLLTIDESGGSATSIFSTKPSLSSTAGDDAFLIYDGLTDANISEPSTGFVSPVLSTTDIPQGSIVICNLVDTQIGAEDFHLLIDYIPI